ncbi:MAG: c-type cytochrome [Pirellulales bacterium]|nr:c-type cytochrome [Pirellulales bacterium]
MPATEKTSRDQAKLHVIFAISAIVMLVATLWMMAKDHNREWRKWQLADRSRERWTLEAQLAQAKLENSVALERLKAELASARSTKVDGQLVDQFIQLVKAEDARLQAAKVAEVAANFSKLEAVRDKLTAAEDGSTAAAAAREQLIGQFESFIREAKRREGALLTKKKFVAADQTAAVSARGIAVGEGKPTDEIEEKIRGYAARVVELDADVAAAKDYRMGLEGVVKQVQAAELELQKKIAALEVEQNRLRDNIGTNTTTVGEWINRGPVLDALYTGNIKLDQIWLPEMKINYNFSFVARYDRCIVCHRAIDKTAPGSATEPAYPAIARGERERQVQLSTPEEAPEAVADKGPADALATVYGIVLAPSGQVDPSAVTIQVVAPMSLAAKAGLQMGDIIQEIGGSPISTQEDVRRSLLEKAEWGQPIDLKIRRGLDQPFTSHPRLDLFVGSTSPHKKGEMGCTICHDGQGSATEFKWASHTPNDPHQALDWTRNHGWFNNHHWIFPMTPDRFIESNCLKCHHEVVDLMPSERFPEPPAPKLVKGYELVREYGCFGCHEVGGYDGPAKRIGPDLRLEPSYSEVAAQLLADPGLNDAEREFAKELVARPDSSTARSALMQSVLADAKPAKSDAEAVAGAEEAAAAKPRLTAVSHALADALKDVEVPGSFRKVGPSLRYLNAKVDYAWLYSWIRKPADFRPTTRMPQFFLNHEHLDGSRKAFKIHDAAGNIQEISDLEFTQRFENIEIRSLAQFLLSHSQPFEYLAPPAGGVEAPSPERGKHLFETRGCLACHSHVDFPEVHATQGPDLSRVGAKLNSEKGRKWLYSWIKAPNHYHARTAMPNLYLDLIEEKDAAGNATGKMTDPAADVMAYLVGVPTDWKPETPAPPVELSADERAALQDLTAVWLTASFPRLRAERFAKDGIDPRLATSLKVDERVLIGPYRDENDRAQRQLDYVGRRSLSRYGCFGCHDIPGYETAKPIGTPLASWGRKEPAQLAFENIGRFLATHGEHIPTKPPAAASESPAAEEPSANDSSSATEETSTTAESSAAASASVPESLAKGSPAPPEHEAHKDGSHEGGHEVDPIDEKFDSDTAYFLQSLNSHERNGFLWQKLRLPRSFDFETTGVKRYDERLRMPKFPFTAEEREAVMTFVLGLTNESPDSRYVYKPGPRQRAIVEGRHVLDKYNCAGCHVIDVQRWDVAFAPDQFESPPTTSDFPFLLPNFSPKDIEDSVRTDSRGLLHAQLYGMPVLDDMTGQTRLVDEDGLPIEPDDDESPRFFEFTPYVPAMVGGEVRKVGVQNIKIPATMDGKSLAQGKVYTGYGGDLARYLYPRVIAQERELNPNAVPTEAWGWLPPPLHHEGVKVQANWLHDFLMDPTAIRPAVVLRMPNFHMSSAEASKLVNYFAAKSNAQYPYEYNARRRNDYLATKEQGHPALFGDAMKVVTDSNYCVKCHSVGDYKTTSAVKASGPNLDQVYRRLRPEYVHRWVANPQRILPYTGMPVNIPYDATAPPNFGGISQSLFPGPSADQLGGVVDLLMNFDEYARRQTSVKSLVKEPASTEQPASDQSSENSPPNNTSASR